MNAPLSIQVIKSLAGEPEYVLIPIVVYNALRDQIEEEIAGLEALSEKDEQYIAFHPEDYVANPVALARIKAHVTQGELAERMGVSQAYVSKIESQARVTAKVIEKVMAALDRKSKKSTR